MVFFTATKGQTSMTITSDNYSSAVEARKPLTAKGWTCDKVKRQDPLTPMGFKSAGKEEQGVVLIASFLVFAAIIIFLIGKDLIQYWLL